MSSILATLVLLPAALLLAAGLLPTFLRAGRWRRDATLLTAVQSVAALAAAALAAPTLLNGAAAAAAWQSPWHDALPLTVWYDGPAALMLALVSFVGAVVCRFSVRYLDGEPNIDVYFQRVCLTIGAVSLFVMAGNLLLLIGAWALASAGLHRLLLHYGDRAAAVEAARTKLLITRTGDALLFAGAFLCWQLFGTFELRAIFAAAAGVADASPEALLAAAWMLIVGAGLKSIQFPAHIWLPETLDTPTPVSALMHAGIVNAGGFLVIRLSPLMTETPAALAGLAVLGAATACYGSVVMLTQTSIKRSLAYSTIAQMGFMMLQCGLGAFSAAMLHILAHSLYKAYAFLNSGSVVEEADRSVKPAGPPASPATLAAALAISIGLVAGAGFAFQIDWSSKSGGLVLGFVLTLALTAWLRDALSDGSLRTARYGLLAAAGMTAAYLGAFIAVDHFVAGGVAPLTAPVSPLAAATVALMFGGLFVLHLLLASARGRRWLAPVQIHAVNGFYVEAAARRLFGPLATR